MATIQKPNNERTKKTRRRQSQLPIQNQEEEEGEAEPGANPAELKISKQVQQIPEISCSTVHKNEQLEETEQKEEEENISFTEEVKQIETNTTLEENVSLQDELQKIETIEGVLEPTAPPADVVCEKGPPLLKTEEKIIQYPNLQLLQYVETKSEITYHVPTTKASTDLLCDGNQITPFTKEELKEFYYCAELEQVNQFELEFLMNSLLETHETDPLYILLQEYYNLQNNLCLMRYDIMQLRKEMQKAQKEIWKQTTITKSFSGCCGDGKTVSENVSYKYVQKL